MQYYDISALTFVMLYVKSSQTDFVFLGYYKIKFNNEVQR